MVSLAETWKEGHKHHSSDRAVRLASALKCLKLVRPLVAFDNVIDFGCGLGTWLYAAQVLGARHILGVEGEWISSADTQVGMEHIITRDLSVEQPTFSKEFDLAMTIEVAEHLPESAADGFCQSLISASDHILFSAAIPGQGGVGHINEQPLPYWVNKFWAHRYVPIEPIRPYISSDRTVLPWLRQNIVMFVNYDLLLRSQSLMRHARPIDEFRLVHRIL